MMDGYGEDQVSILRNRSLPGFSLGDEFQYPVYDGHSILNLPASLCNWLGVPPLAGAPLAPEMLAPLAGQYRRVVLVVVDALAWHRLLRWMEDGTAPVWKNCWQAGGLLAPLTSVVPSTTSAALTCLWTGRSPAVHGVVGYELWLKEFGVVANMITHAPMSLNGERGSLRRAGLKPETFLPMQTLGTYLAAQGVAVHALENYAILKSDLTQLLLKDVNLHGFYTPTDLWGNLRQLLESQADRRIYTYVYWGDIDTFSHHYGPEDERTAAEFAAFSTAFERQFLARLSPELRRDTLVILTADHGQIATPPRPAYDLRNHTDLTRCLHLAPTGEHRLSYLYIRPGQTEAVRAYVEGAWEHEFVAVNPFDAIQAGLFGPGEPHPHLYERVGDLMVIARHHSYWWWAEQDNRLFGRHGGLAPEEMLVPLLVFSPG